MQITQAADYALRAVLNLSCKEKGIIVDAKLIAEEESIPLRFLLKIFRLLIQAGIVKSFRGVNGGYMLSKDPKEINMRQVIEAVEGPIRLNKCLVSSEKCNLHVKSNSCNFHKAFGSIQKNVIEQLENFNFEALLQSRKNK